MKEAQKVVKVGWFGLLGFGATLLFFLIAWGWPSLDVPVALTLVATLVLVALTFWLTMKISAHGSWSDEHRLALVAGALVFWCLLAPLQELDKTRTDNTFGMSMVGLATVLFLVWLWRRVRRRTPQHPLETAM